MARVVAIAVLAMLLTSPLLAESAGQNGSFKELAAQAEKDLSTAEGSSFHKEMVKTFLRKLSGPVGFCDRIHKESASIPFQAVIVVKAEGTVGQVAVNPETDMSKCVQQQLLKAKFGKPPFAPFHSLMRVSLEVD